MELREHQIDALQHLRNGSVLWGGVGSGKSAVALAYYMQVETPKDIVVITTAKKRDSLDWEKEAAKFGIGKIPGGTLGGILTVDSWNNIGKYVDHTDCFFVFDEQRVVGTGFWVRSFLKITKKNHWILLSATPGDSWLDYGPIFVANGFFKSITEFKREHVIFRPYVRFPQVSGYRGEERLEKMRNYVLVEMPYLSKSKRVLNWIDVGYDVMAFGTVLKGRWNIYENRPLKDAAEMFWLLRRVANEDPERLRTIRSLLKTHPRMIIFYSFNYELEILRTLCDEITVAEWNGHRKQPVPSCERWVYLVQYTSGAESWNCTETDTMVFYSLTYSYKMFHQAQGRIDRLDSSFETLFYYILRSKSMIDQAVSKRLADKKSFNERAFGREVLGLESWL